MQRRSGSVVVITSALHAEGREFEPRSDLTFFYQSFILFLIDLKELPLKTGAPNGIHRQDKKLGAHDLTKNILLTDEIVHIFKSL